MYPTHLARCLRLLQMLQSRLGYTAQELAHTLKVSCRTVFRDLALLKETGIHILSDPTSGGYCTARSIDVNAFPLSDDELITLLLAAHISALSCGETLAGPIRQSLCKLLNALPVPIREEAGRLLHAIIGEPPAVPWPEDSETIAEILLAIRQKRCLRIAYRMADGSSGLRQTKVAPYRLVGLHGKWHLVGQSSWHRKVCRFDLRHICRAEMTDETCCPVKTPRHKIAVSHLIT